MKDRLRNNSPWKSCSESTLRILFKFIESSHYYLLIKVTFYHEKQPPEVFCKKTCSQEFRKIHKKTLVPTLAQVFSCEFCEISKNTFLAEHVGTSASISWLEDSYKAVI